MKKILFAFWLFVYTSLAFAGLASPNFGGQPYFSAYMSAATQTVTAGANTKLGFNTLDYDSGGYFDTTNNRFLPKVAGKYWVTCSASFTTISTTGGYSALVYKNGSLFAYAYQALATGAAGQQYAQAKSIMVPLNGSTDYVECWGATPGTVVTGGSNNFTNFQAFYLGP